MGRTDFRLVAQGARCTCGALGLLGCPTCLLLHHAAGDPIAGIARRIGLVIVWPGVNHQRRAARMKQRIHSVAQRNHVAVMVALPLPFAPS